MDKMIIDKFIGYGLSILGGSGLSMITLHNVYETAIMAFIIGVCGGLGGVLVKFVADRILKKK